MTDPQTTGESRPPRRSPLVRLPAQVPSVGISAHGAGHGSLRTHDLILLSSDARSTTVSKSC